MARSASNPAGYSGTPLPKKLGIREGSHVCAIRPPSKFDVLLEPLPDGVTLKSGLRSKGPFDVALLFATRVRELEQDFAKVAERLTPAGGLWVCWPKKSADVPTELSDSVVREFGLTSGLVDNKVCAVDETWSALRFVVRVRDRGPR